MSYLIETTNVLGKRRRCSNELDTSDRPYKRACHERVTTIARGTKRAREGIDREESQRVRKRARVMLEEEETGGEKEKSKDSPIIPAPVLGKHPRSCTDSDDEERRVKRARTCKAGEHSAPSTAGGVDCARALTDPVASALDERVGAASSEDDNDDDDDEIVPWIPAEGELVYESIEVPDGREIDQHEPSSPSSGTEDSFTSDTEEADDTQITVPDDPSPGTVDRETEYCIPEVEEQLPEVPEREGLFGLINCSNACYANAAIQMLDHALTTEQVAKLRGNEDLDAFNDKERAQVWKYDMTSGDLGVQRKKPYKVVKARIQGLGSQVRKSGYLGQLLFDMRTGVKSGRRIPDHVSPFLFQHIFALCGDKTRPQYDGFTQQDAGEYLEDVVQTAVEETALAKEAFEIVVETTKTCVAEGCKSSVSSTTTALHVHLCARDSKSSLEDLLEAELERHEAMPMMTCGSCASKGSLIEHVKTSALPKSFFIQISRGASSNQVSIPFDEPLDTPFGRYSVSAVICREGSSDVSGHYRCLRRFDDGWFKFDDKEVEPVKAIRAVRDGMRGLGSSTVLLMSRASGD